MERFGVKELYNIKYKNRFHEIYEEILSSARTGYKRKEIWWKHGDNIKHLKDQISWFFLDVTIEDKSDHVVVSWDIQNNNPA